MAKNPESKKVAEKSTTARKKKGATSPVPTEIKRDRVDWRTLYLYALCLITMLVSLFSVVSILRSGVSLIFPDPGYIDLNSTASKASQELMRQSQANQNHREAIRGIVNGFATLVVSAPLYLYHWRMVRTDGKS